MQFQLDFRVKIEELINKIRIIKDRLTLALFGSTAYTAALRRSRGEAVYARATRLRRGGAE